MVLSVDPRKPDNKETKTVSTQPDFARVMHCEFLPGLCDKKLHGQYKQNHLKQQSCEGQILFSSRYHTGLIDANDSLGYCYCGEALSVVRKQLGLVDMSGTGRSGSSCRA